MRKILIIITSFLICGLVQINAVPFSVFWRGRAMNEPINMPATSFSRNNFELAHNSFQSPYILPKVETFPVLDAEEMMTLAAKRASQSQSKPILDPSEDDFSRFQRAEQNNLRGRIRAPYSFMRGKLVDSIFKSFRPTPKNIVNPVDSAPLLSPDAEAAFLRAEQNNLRGRQRFPYFLSRDRLGNLQKEKIRLFVSSWFGDKRSSRSSVDSTESNLSERDRLRQARKSLFMNMQEKLPVPSQVEKDANGLRVVTFNVGKFKDLEGKDSLHSITDSIIQSKAEVVALQEVSTKRLAELESKLEQSGQGYKAVKCNYLGGRSMVLLISSTLGVSNTGSANALDRCIPFATVKRQDGEQLNIANVHLSHFSPSLRKLQLDIANRKVGRSAGDSLIVGDFNMPDRNQVQSIANFNGKIPLLGGEGVGNLGDAFTHWKGINVDHAVANPELAKILSKAGAMQQTGSDHTMLHLDFIPSTANINPSLTTNSNN